MGTTDNQSLELVWAYMSTLSQGVQAHTYTHMLKNGRGTLWFLAWDRKCLPLVSLGSALFLLLFAAWAQPYPASLWVPEKLRRLRATIQVASTQVNITPFRAFTPDWSLACNLFSFSPQIQDTEVLHPRGRWAQKGLKSRKILLIVTKVLEFQPFLTPLQESLLRWRQPCAYSCICKCPEAYK